MPHPQMYAFGFVVTATQQNGRKGFQQLQDKKKTGTHMEAEAGDFVAVAVCCGVLMVNSEVTIARKDVPIAQIITDLNGH